MFIFGVNKRVKAFETKCYCIYERVKRLEDEIEDISDFIIV